MATEFIQSNGIWLSYYAKYSYEKFAELVDKLVEIKNKWIGEKHEST